MRDAAMEITMNEENNKKMEKEIDLSIVSHSRNNHA